MRIPQFLVPSSLCGYGGRWARLTGIRAGIFPRFRKHVQFYAATRS